MFYQKNEIKKLIGITCVSGKRRGGDSDGFF